MTRSRLLRPGLVILAASAAIFRPGAQTPQLPPVEEANPRYILMEEADSAIAGADYDRAAARLLDAIAVCPDCPDNALLLSNLGMVYAYSGRDSLALATLDQALATWPGLRTAIANKGRLLLSMGRDAEAKAAYSSLIELDSLNIDARYYRGMLALYSGDLETAEADMTVLRDSMPDSTPTARALASLYTMTGRHELAVPYYRQLIREEEAPEYYAMLASCYLTDSELTEASAVIGEGLAKYPDDGELYYCRAWLNKLQYRTAEATADARRAQSLGVPRARIRALLSQ